MTDKQILVFKHMPSQNPGIFRSYAQTFGIHFTEVDLHAGDAIPSLAGFDGLWVMGGSMNVWEEAQYPWLIEEKAVIRQAIKDNQLPFLGVCLGHQLAAEALGGTVRAASYHELGLSEVQLTEAGRQSGLFQDMPSAASWMNVHLAEVETIPDDAVVLARSTLCPVHAMQLGPTAFTVQYHAETCDRTVADWLQIPGVPELLADKLGDDWETLFANPIAAHLAEHNAQARLLLRNWCNLCFGDAGSH